MCELGEESLVFHWLIPLGRKTSEGLVPSLNPDIDSEVCPCLTAGFGVSFQWALFLLPTLCLVSIYVTRLILKTMTQLVTRSCDQCDCSRMRTPEHAGNFCRHGARVLVSYVWRRKDAMNCSIQFSVLFFLVENLCWQYIIPFNAVIVSRNDHLILINTISECS